MISLKQKRKKGIFEAILKMYILGISCFYHDSSAALLKDGKIVAAAQEERFTRKKHDTQFPINAIKYCLKSQNISIDDINYIGFYEKPLLKFERILYLITFFAVLIIISRAVNIYSIKSWEKQQKYGKDGILVGAESYHFDRGGDNIVMLHSLGGSPAEFKDIAIYLAGKKD